MDSSRQNGRLLYGGLRLYQDQFIADGLLAGHGWRLEILNDAENGDGDTYLDAHKRLMSDTLQIKSMVSARKTKLDC